MRILFLLAVTLLLVAIACGSDTTATQPATQPTEVPTSTVTAPPTSAVTAPSALIAGATDATPTTEAPIVITAPALTEERFVEDAVLQRLGPEPPTLDPHITVSGESALYVVEIYGGLVTIDRNLRVVPDLAKDWEISNGGMTYTLSLIHISEPTRPY